MPLVGIVTPVYNGERYLAECIESVLHQSFTDWEYVIVDNASTDRTLEIANAYAAGDARIRVVAYQDHVPVTASFNRAAALVSSGVRYLKFLCADDVLFPECLQLMVGLAEAKPSVVLVGSYKIHGDAPVCEGPPFPVSVVKGRDACQQFFGDKMGILGSETNHLIRVPAPLVDGRLFDEAFFHADIECFVRLLTYAGDLGFVHQVLTFTRVHSRMVSHYSHVKGLGPLEFLAILTRHGQAFANREKFESLLKSYRRLYHRVLFKAWIKFWDRTVWRFQLERANTLGVRIKVIEMMLGAFDEAVAFLVSPRARFDALSREWDRIRGLRTQP